MKSQAFWILLGMVSSTAEQGRAAATETILVPGKAGWCPVGSAQEPLPSKLYCLLDESCPGGQKCCSLGRMRICVQPALVNPGYCPTACPTALEPCRVSCLEDAACGPGQKCCLQDCQLRCVVAEPARPGLCPRRRALPTGTPCRNQCEDDRGCPPGLKCCFSGCGLECLRPRAEVPGGCTDPPAPKCQDRCREDSDCLKEETCRPTACGFQCQGPPPGKPGVCPLLLRGSLGPCLDEMLKTCTHDFDCEEAKKCCSNGCRMVCRKPGEGAEGSSSSSSLTGCSYMLPPPETCKLSCCHCALAKSLLDGCLEPLTNSPPDMPGTGSSSSKLTSGEASGRLNTHLPTH